MAFDFESLEYEEGQKLRPLVVHEDALAVSSSATAQTTDRILMEGNSSVAKAVTLFGPGVLVLPMMGHVAGVEQRKLMFYGAHPRRAKDGVVDRSDLEERFGQLDPLAMAEELSRTEPALEEHLKELDDETLRREVLELQDWRTQAAARMKTLERRVACSFLGLNAEGKNADEIRKAFKRKALELHPDKGGDADRFLLLQEMKDLLVENCEEEGEKGEEEEGDDEMEMQEMKFPNRDKEAEEEILKALEKGQKFDRDRHLKARRDQHNGIKGVWRRVEMLQEEISKVEDGKGISPAVKHLRKYVERFAADELSKLSHGDVRTAERLFRKFVDQGGEILCAAAVVDPATTTSVVAMQVNHRLISRSASKDMKNRCAALLEAIQKLPEDLGHFVDPLEEQIGTKKKLRNKTESPKAGDNSENADKENKPGNIAKDDAVVGEEWKEMQERKDETVKAEEHNDGNDEGEEKEKDKELEKQQKEQEEKEERERQEREQNEKEENERKEKEEKERKDKEERERKDIEEKERKEKEEREQKEKERLKKEESARRIKEEMERELREERESKEKHARERRERMAKRQEESSKGDTQSASQMQRSEFQPPPRSNDATVVTRKEEKIPSATPPKCKLDEKASTYEKQASDDEWFDDFFGEASKPESKKPQGASCHTLAAKAVESRLRAQKTCWDADFDHPCAGDRKEDGSGIFCFPCDRWIASIEPFDTRGFELHCEQVGHYGWID